MSYRERAICAAERRADPVKITSCRQRALLAGRPRSATPKDNSKHLMHLVPNRNKTIHNNPNSLIVKASIYTQQVNPHGIVNHQIRPDQTKSVIS
jgi:hypothetical protein